MDKILEPILAPLRPHLQPLTASLPHPIRDLSISLLGDVCHKHLILDVSPDPHCVSLAISKVLGIGIIGASSVVKIPQLLKLLSSKSAAGLSFTAYFLELASQTINLAYNARSGFPFSTYGEQALIAAQNIAIAGAILHFTGKSATAAVFVAGLAAAGYALSNEGIVSGEALKSLAAVAGVLGVGSKVPQIYTVWQQGGTGQLSAFAVFNYLFGSLSRIFTTLKEVDDPLILYGFVAGFALNAVLAAQMLYYWNAPATNDEKLKEPIAVPAGKEKAKTTGAKVKGASASTRRRG